MTIRVYYCDLRNSTSHCERYVAEWKIGITAKEALSQTMGIEIANSIANDLVHNNQQLIVAWNDMTTGEISEVGGVGNLDFELKDNNVITITYHDETTTNEQIDASSEWMLMGEEVD